MKKFLAILLALLLNQAFLAQVVLSATYFVATNGTDTNCTTIQTITTPAQNASFALACAGARGTTEGAGDTVQFAAGSYAVSLVDNIPNGTSGNVFTLQCATNGACFLNPGSNNPAIEFGGTPSSWITIRGFVVTSGDGFQWSSASNPGHTDIIVEDNEFVGATMHSTAMGIQASGVHRLTARRNHIHGLNGDNGFSHAIYAAGRTADWVIEDNIIHDNGAYGIHVYYDSPAGEPANTGFIIRRNATYRNGTTNVNGTGIITYGGPHDVYANVVYDNLNEGIIFRAVSGTIKVYNNTAWSNVYTGISNESGSTVTCTNNLSTDNGVGQITGCTTTTTNITTGNQADLFLNAGAGDFRLASGSAAIDAGTTLGAPYNIDKAGTTRPFGANYDVGAFEAGEGSEPPTCDAVTPELVAQYGFNGNANDSSGNGFNGTVGTGGTFVAGKYGQAVSLVGTGEVTVAHDDKLWMCGGYTLGAWVNPSNTPTDFAAVISKLDGGGVGYFMYSAAHVSYCANNGPIAGYHQTNDVYDCYATAFTPSTWTHYAETWDGTTLRKYINANLVASASGNAIIDNTLASLLIGGSAFGERFQGLVDEVHIYNCALGQSSPIGACSPAGVPQTITDMMNTPVSALTSMGTYKANSSAIRKNNASVVKKYGPLQ